MAEVSNLADELLRQARIGSSVDELWMISEQGSTNRTYRVRTEAGQQLVLRQYAWPHEGPDLERVEKEVSLHEYLRAHGVPVPRVLAAVSRSSEQGVLLEHVPGRPLGELRDLTGTHDWQDAWRKVGDVLRRVHQIRYPPGTAGVLVGTETRPFEAGSWGRFHIESILDHAERLVRRRQLTDTTWLREVLERAGDVFADHEACLLHNDPHPWNVLVQRSPTGWDVTALLDWEYAWVGEPTWDLIRMDMFRRRNIGPTPDAFWEGCGARPDETRRRLYMLHINLWMANEALEGSTALPTTYENALRYVGDLERHLEHLEHLLP